MSKPRVRSELSETLKTLTNVWSSRYGAKLAHCYTTADAQRKIPPTGVSSNHVTGGAARSRSNQGSTRASFKPLFSHFVTGEFNSPPIIYGHRMPTSTPRSDQSRDDPRTRSLLALQLSEVLFSLYLSLPSVPGSKLRRLPITRPHPSQRLHLVTMPRRRPIAR